MNVPILFIVMFVGIALLFWGVFEFDAHRRGYYYASRTKSYVLFSLGALMLFGSIAALVFL